MYFSEDMHYMYCCFRTRVSDFLSSVHKWLSFVQNYFLLESIAFSMLECSFLTMISLSIFFNIVFRDAQFFQNSISMTTLMSFMKCLSAYL